MSDLPGDHGERLGRVRLALDGLSVGDAIGPSLGLQQLIPQLFPASRTNPPEVRSYIADTDQAIGVARVLAERGRIDQDRLARVLADRYVRSLSIGDRQYGATVKKIFMSLADGAAWHDVNRRSFGGTGSMGNGAAMRVAPVGAYFADDVGRVVAEADRSAEITHAHPEGRAGAIAVAVAAATARALRETASDRPLALFDAVLRHTPPGPTRDGVARARELPFTLPPLAAAAELGNGSRVTAPDTVPYAIWSAARALDDFVEALWLTSAGRGDVDTKCAIVGGIVSLAVGPRQIPAEWIALREPLDFPPGNGETKKLENDSTKELRADGADHSHRVYSRPLPVTRNSGRPDG